MKRYFITILAVVGLFVAGLQLAEAQAGWSDDGPGPGYGREYGPGSGRGHGPDHERCWKCLDGPRGGAQMTPAEEEARTKFLDATVETRKALAEKQTALEALMKQDKPDEDKAAKLAGDIFDLKNKFRKATEESGMKGGFGPGSCGCGGMGGGMHDGPRHDRGKHRMMRDW